MPHDPKTLAALRALMGGTDEAAGTALDAAANGHKAPNADPLKPDPADRAPAKKETSKHVVCYYELVAEHERFVPVGATHKFRGFVQWARVRLPAKPSIGFWPYQTNLGAITQGDHFFHNVNQLQKALAGQGLSIERADLIAPGRLISRFAAASIYLCYTKATDPRPSFYVAEVGSAMGSEEAFYAANGFAGPQVDPAGFRFTPFADPKHLFEHAVTLNGDDPTQIVISAFRTAQAKRPGGEGPYLRNTVTLTRRTSAQIEASGIFLPGRQQGIAGHRMVAIGEKLPKAWIVKPDAFETSKKVVPIVWPNSANPPWIKPPG